MRHTTAIGASGSPAVLVEMMTYLGYRWHPEYTVYEEYQDFNQSTVPSSTSTLGSMTPLSCCTLLMELE